MSDPVFEFGEPTWLCHVYFHEDGYYIKMPFQIDGKRGIAWGFMSVSPEEEPEIYADVIRVMKEAIPGQYERGEIHEPPELIAD